MFTKYTQCTVHTAVLRSRLGASASQSIALPPRSDLVLSLCPGPASACSHTTHTHTHTNDGGQNRSTAGPRGEHRHAVFGWSQKVRQLEN